MEQMNEPNTDLFVSFLQAVIPGIRIAYPVTNFETGEMYGLLTEDDTIYEKNVRGIIEPVNGKLITANEIDLIIVPLLVIDKKGNRCGYGKGFYDKYLSFCKADSIKLGFSYFEPVDKIQDTDTFDVPLTHCITPQHIYEFQ
jgi:5-formyltetrahydrofolate cyclo-ligase